MVSLLLGFSVLSYAESATIHVLKRECMFEVVVWDSPPSLGSRHHTMTSGLLGFRRTLLASDPLPLALTLEPTPSCPDAPTLWTLSLLARFIFPFAHFSSR